MRDQDKTRRIKQKIISDIYLCSIKKNFQSQYYAKFTAPLGKRKISFWYLLSYVYQTICVLPQHLPCWGLHRPQGCRDLPASTGHSPAALPQRRPETKLTPSSGTQR